MGAQSGLGKNDPFLGSFLQEQSSWVKNPAGDFWPWGQGPKSALGRGFWPIFGPKLGQKWLKWLFLAIFGGFWSKIFAQSAKSAKSQILHGLRLCRRPISRESEVRVGLWPWLRGVIFGQNLELQILDQKPGPSG